jgi:hypothetical protein
MRFRKNAVAITSDIEQMFYQFRVTENHRDYTKFFWYQDNDLSKPLIEYRMASHVFGNTLSPAVATYGLRQAVAKPDEDVKSLLCCDFYVDDGLTSLTDKEQAIKLVMRTHKSLMDNSHIRLHKIVSNNVDVMKAFSTDELGKDLTNLDLYSDILPTQQSLGLSWDLHPDKFIFRLNDNEKPATRRGLLLTINIIFDPLGFISPIVIS